jgi:hypothetical protein
MGGYHYSIMGLSLGGCTYNRATFVSEVATNIGPCWEVATVRELSSGGYQYVCAVRKVDSIIARSSLAWVRMRQL